jgi:hypothetical protein
MRLEGHLLDDTYDWLAVNDSSETLLLVAWWIDTEIEDGSLTELRGLTGTLGNTSSCMCSIFGMTKAGTSGKVTGGIPLSGQERSSRTGLGESGGSGKAHAETLGNS